MYRLCNAMLISLKNIKTRTTVRDKNCEQSFQLETKNSFAVFCDLNLLYMSTLKRTRMLWCLYKKSVISTSGNEFFEIDLSLNNQTF